MAMSETEILQFLMRSRERISAAVWVVVRDSHVAEEAVVVSDEARVEGYRREPVRNWESDLDRGPARAEGVWKPAEEERPARLGTIPKFLPDTHDGAVTIHSVRVPARSADGRSVEFTSDSVVRIRGYLRRPESIEVMLGLNLRKGGWAGNFFHRTKTLPAGPWEIEIPAVYFKKWRYHAKTTPPELTRVRQTVVYTIDTDAGLEIVSVEIAESG